MTEGVNSVAFSPDGKRIVTASADKTAVLWDLEGHPLVSFRGHEEAVIRAAFHPHRPLVLTAGTDRAARLFHLDGSLITTYGGHSSPLVYVHFASDRDRVLTVHQDRTLRYWYVNTKDLLDLARRRAYRGFTATERERFKTLIDP